jgi:guanylate kinase
MTDSPITRARASAGAAAAGDPARLQRRGLMLVLSSPSGAGKTTISRRLLETDDNLSMSVSVTTRPPRPGERDGVDYRFIDRAAYDAMVADGALLEHARVFDNFYGTPRAAVEAALNAGQDILFDIDWQGTQQLKEAARDDLVSVFVLPPSAGELERRLRARAQDSDTVIAGRMAKAADELSHYAEYDYVLVNTDLDASVDRVRAILEAERARRERLVGLGEFVRTVQGEL